MDQYPKFFEHDCTKVATHFSHEILWKEGAEPIQHKVRNNPLAVLPAVAKELQRLQDEGYIEPIEVSEWVSPIIVAHKHDGRVRLCIDLRDVNSKIIVERYPMPNIHEMLLTLESARVFTIIDLSTAYHRVPLTDESKDITAFITTEGLFRFTRIPFGLASASFVFQRMMHKIFKDVKRMSYFQDDILIHAKDQEEHDKLLRTVLARLKENSLTVQRDKCKFNQTTVDYLGHTVTPDGIKPKESLVTAVVDAPAPQNKEQLRSFLGLCEYMSKFVKNFVNKAAPLCAMMKDKVNFVLDKTHQKVFDDIKSEIAKRPTLSAFDSLLNVETILTTDASQYGLGAVLSQMSNCVKQRIIFVSRTLSDAEKNYSVIEKETLAVHWATQRLRTFVWRRRFTVQTDHKPLTSILTTKGFASHRTSQRINKWSTLLLEYNFDIQYIPGVNNNAADCMSRLPLQSLEEDFTDDDICIAEVSDITNGAISTQQFQAATQEDSTLQKAISYMHSQWPICKSLQGDMQGLYNINYELSVRNGLLYRSDQLVVPESLRPTILQHAHEGHFGMTLVKRLDKQVEHLVRDCHVCASSDKPYRTYQAPMTPTPPPEGPWQKVAMDIMGPFKKGLFHRAWNRTLHFCTVPSSR